jgi:hypothetical protein
MKAVILYHMDAEHSRKVEEFAHDFSVQHPDGRVELVSLESADGADKARLYDVTQYPAVLALNDDGKLQKVWQGSLPLMNELAYYATQ